MKNNKRIHIILLFLIGLTLAAGTYAYNANTTGNAEQTNSIASAPDSEAGDYLQNGDPGTDSTLGGASNAETAQPAPVPSPTTTTYTVKSGDTLWDIAAVYHTTVAQLQALNHLTSDALSLGQTLLVAGQADQGIKVAQQAPAPTPSRSGTTSRTAVLQYAAKYLHTPYKYGGTTPAGFDCSGFVQYVYKHFGVSLPRTAAAQASAGVRVDKANLSPGDLVFFKTGSSGIDHVGIYAGSGRFIHSSSPTSGGVIYTSLGESFYARTYAGARRLSY